jgi:tRNA nucleotidyltransferase (CCA-adding enzyme)
MEILATHVAADFDGFAAMIAARRFHPEARLFFPGSKEGSLRRLLETGLVAFPELRQKEIDPTALTRVILCDVRQVDRVGILAAWLRDHPGIEVWAYDIILRRNPGRDCGPEAGGASTLIVEELRRGGWIACRTRPPYS